MVFTRGASARLERDALDARGLRGSAVAEREGVPHRGELRTRTVSTRALGGMGKVSGVGVAVSLCAVCDTDPMALVAAVATRHAEDGALAVAARDAGHAIL